MLLKNMSRFQLINNNVISVCKELTLKYDLVFRKANSEYLPFMGRYIAGLNTIDINEHSVNLFYNKVIKDKYNITYDELFYLIFSHELGHAIGQISNIIPKRDSYIEEIEAMIINSEYEAWENGLQFIPYYLEPVYHYYNYYTLFDFYKRNINEIDSYLLKKKFFIGEPIHVTA